MTDARRVYECLLKYVDEDVAKFVMLKLYRPRVLVEKGVLKPEEVPDEYIKTIDEAVELSRLDLLEKLIREKVRTIEGYVDVLERYSELISPQLRSELIENQNRQRIRPGERPRGLEIAYKNSRLPIAFIHEANRVGHATLQVRRRYVSNS